MLNVCDVNVLLVFTTKDLTKFIKEDTFLGSYIEIPPGYLLIILVFIRYFLFGN